MIDNTCAMDAKKTGELIYSLRKRSGMTQKELAQALYVSDKAVSKWENGGGFPELSLLPDIAAIFDIRLEDLLRGEIEEKSKTGGNMRNLKFYVCPQCGNLITATEGAEISCCGKNLEAIEAVKAPENEKLGVELIENEYFLSSTHEMTKEHYIMFVALLTGDGIYLRRQYPEWDLQTRLPRLAHGKLLWYCNKHGLFYQLI